MSTTAPTAAAVDCFYLLNCFDDFSHANEVRLLHTIVSCVLIIMDNDKLEKNKRLKIINIIEIETPLELDVMGCGCHVNYSHRSRTNTHSFYFIVQAHQRLFRNRNCILPQRTQIRLLNFPIADTKGGIVVDSAVSVRFNWFK